MITIIAALSMDGAIGFGNRLLYHLNADMKRFKALTIGHTLLMGRNTFESLPNGALPGRRNIVLTRDRSRSFPNAETYASLDEALYACNPDEQIFIIGGAQVYSQALPLAQRLELTVIHDIPEQADAAFPSFRSSPSWQLTFREDHPADDKNPFPYSFLTYIKEEPCK
ncbi:MAG: dihydrofolate reductase [Bacteroidaceae bacterium]|nr:dihydrofolate reductase [Bacteroidaceae bacterium]